MSEYESKQDQIGELREQANKLRQAGGDLDTLLAQLRREMNTLGEEWNDPAAGEIQAIIAGVFQQTNGMSAMLNDLAQKFFDKSDEVEQTERAKRYQSPAEDDDNRDQQ
jgi:uncharacterized protein YukE